MSDRRWALRLARECERAGLTVIKTRKGWRVLSPDGRNSVGWHETPSDWRAERNTRAAMRRAGLDLTED